MEKLSSSLEDYLEVILALIGESGWARAKDIASRLNVKAASVTGALRRLASKDLVHYAPYGHVTLTTAGKRVARDIRMKHDILLNFFTRALAMPSEEAETFACKMEHAIPDHALERFIAFAEVVDRCPRCGTAWQRNAKPARKVGAPRRIVPTRERKRA